MSSLTAGSDGRTVFPPCGTSLLLLGQPRENGVLAVPHIPPQPDMREQPGSRVFADASFGDGEHRGDLPGGQQAIGCSRTGRNLFVMVRIVIIGKAVPVEVVLHLCGQPAGSRS